MKPSGTYDYNAIEPHWQDQWARAEAFRAANPGEPGAERPKYYVLDFFPYPSGAGLHVGHPLGYIASDIIARYKRMRGFNVLHPMGWDAFGLPAEQYAVETNVHPRETTRKNIDTYKRQLRMIGLGYDWSREISTTDPEYYRWTQWIFLQIYNAWYDPEFEWTDAAGRRVVGAARPIDQLPIPPEVRKRGADEVEDYLDQHRLAFRAEAAVNWCPALGTVLANEEVTNEGRSERGNHPVFRRPMKQWTLRITEYAERLLHDLETLDWPESIKLMQRNWIGRSQGAYVDFALADDQDNVIRVFTTRPDTLFGATYLVLAPEHRLTPIITKPDHQQAVSRYVTQAAQKTDLDRTADVKVKTGVFTGAYAINPVNNARVPIWVADYVLATYGTGSIMAVPGGDKRDYEFARAFSLPVVPVVAPRDARDAEDVYVVEGETRACSAGVDVNGQPCVMIETGCFAGEGVSVNSPGALGERFAGQCELNGLPTAEAKRKITEWLEQRGVGEGTTQYKLRDWMFARQRYWGEPFPLLIDENGHVHPEDEANLPVLLPEMDDFRPTASDDPNAEPQTPLSRAKDWVVVERDGRKLRREVNTMPQWAGSCWYYLRFCDARSDSAFVRPDVERYWMGDPKGQPRAGGVDLYMGGAEHAVLHLLYARFWHKTLYDLGLVSTPEPFQRLFNQGMIQGFTYRDARDVTVAHEDIEFRGDQAFHKQTGEALTSTVEKMSKSLRNVVNPDAIVAEYGADTLRLYEMYMGPLESSKPWNTRDIIGVHRFLQRLWRLVIECEDETGAVWRIAPRIVDGDNADLERLLHKTVRKVEEDIERFAFNTAIAQMIVFVNEAGKADTLGRGQIARFLRVLAPFAPHICEELHARLGGDGLLAQQDWPAWDAALTRDEEVEYPVQLRGKLKARIRAPADADEAAVVAAAMAEPAVAKALEGVTIKRVIFVPGRLLNLIF